MRKHLAILLAAGGLLSLAFAPAPLPKPAVPSKDDLKEMAGTWEIVERTSSGRPLKSKLSTMAIAGERLTFYRATGTVATQWVLTLDASKSPRWFDRRRDGKSNAMAHGVYELKGDKLTMCYVRGGADRPTDLDGSKPGRWKEVYKRLKR